MAKSLAAGLPVGSRFLMALEKAATRLDLGIVVVV